MKRAEQLIGMMELELKAAQARIAELEREARNDAVAYRAAIERQNELRAELAALKAQEPLTVEFMQFMTAVVTGAGLLSRGKQSKGLASELSATAYKYMLGAQVSGYQQKPIGYRCWFNKEPKNIMVEWGKSLPSDMNPSATYQALYALPVHEAKAQGVVQWPEADEIMQMAFEEGHPADDASGYYFELEEFDLFIERLMSEVARLNAAPVVSAEQREQVGVIERKSGGFLSAPYNSIVWLTGVMPEAGTKLYAFPGYDCKNCRDSGCDPAYAELVPCPKCAAAPAPSTTEGQGDE